MQNNQDAINMVASITGDLNPQLTPIALQNLPTDDVFKNGDLMLVRLRGTDVNGATSASFKDRSVLLIDGQSNFDTGGIFLLCDSIDAIGVSEGAVTVEGWSYTKHS